MMLKKQGDDSSHEHLVSEAASTLAHLAQQGVSSAGTNAESKTTTIEQAGFSTGTDTDPSDASANKSDKLSTNQITEESFTNAASIAAMIKETVLRRLNKPEDAVKRNMFAVEGKSIKFPVKVSSQLTGLCLIS